MQHKENHYHEVGGDGGFTPRIIYRASYIMQTAVTYSYFKNALSGGIFALVWWVR